MTSSPAYSPALPALGCKRNGGKAGDFAQPIFQLFEQLLIAAGLIRRGERMHAAKLRPGDRQHLAGGVQLHRAGLPSGIMLCASDKSRLISLKM